jgi:hypothetical protein
MLLPFGMKCSVHFLKMEAAHSSGTSIAIYSYQYTRNRIPEDSVLYESDIVTGKDKCCCVSLAQEVSMLFCS